MRWKTDADLTGWGGVPSARAALARPERIADVTQLLQDVDEQGLCAFGAGRSYGDCALNGGGHVAWTARLNRILSFDDHTGRVEVEPGVTFRRLLDVFLARGWVAPVTPGTSFVTIGGAVANDVHGKNHEHDGSFGQHVLEIDLLTPEGVVTTLTPDTLAFQATVGGVGLTGLILRVAFTMMKVPGAAMKTKEMRIRDLDDFLAAFESHDSWRYSVGWLDAMAGGRALGRGVLEVSDHVVGHVEPQKPSIKIPFNFPGFALNRISVAAFNTFYYRRVSANGRESIRSLDQALYPLDALRNWNRIYGKTGFRQFQCVIPSAQAQRALPALLQTISASRAASFLSVLKRMGPGRAGYLSFPMAGYSFALDFPNRPGTVELLMRLERIVRDAGGRIYLAKDSALSAEGFAAMYPELDAFRKVRHSLDPMGRMQTDMARRLQIKGGA